VIATGPFDSELSREYRASGTGVKTEEWYRAMLLLGAGGLPDRRDDPARRRIRKEPVLIPVILVSRNHVLRPPRRDVTRRGIVRQLALPSSGEISYPESDI